MITQDLVISKFVAFNRLLSGFKDYEYNSKSRDKKMIDQFVYRINSETSGSAGEQYLNRYMYYQFSKWIDNDMFGGIVMMNWIIGNKAMIQWFEGGNQFDYRKTRMYLSGMILGEAVSREGLDWISSDVQDADRLRFHNTDVGLIHCLDYTTMINPSSPACIMCNNTETCKEVLAYKNPKLYEKRFVDKSNRSEEPDTNKGEILFEVKSSFGRSRSKGNFQKRDSGNKTRRGSIQAGV